MVLRSRAAALAGLVGGFCALAGLVASGALTSLDQYAVDHWMPELEPGGETTPAISVHQLYPHVGTFPRGFFNVWTFPASSFFSAAVLAGCAAVLVRRGQRTAALVWVAAWIGANAVEVVGKTALHRPALHATVAGATLPLRSFDHSFPSGHAVRAVVIVAVLAAVWRRAIWPGLVWIAVVLPALVVTANHTPTDVAGGALLALIAITAAESLVPSRRRARRAVPRLRFDAAILEER